MDVRYKFNLGEKLRRIRKEKGLRLAELAEMTGLSKSFLSQIENDRILPSIETLFRLSNVVGRPMGYFFEETGERDGFIVKENQRKKFVMDVDRTQFELLSPNLKNKKMQAVIVRMGRGGISTEKKHIGEEVGLVVKGKICVYLEGEKYVLGKGDSIYFSSCVPHRIENIGDSEALLFWVMTPPSF